MKQKLVITLTLTLLLQYSFGQIIDRFGLNIGASYSNQIWDYKLTSFELEHDYKIGFMTFVFAEKDFSEILSLRVGLGYLQKGFKDKFEFTSPDGTMFYEEIDNLKLHNLAIDLGCKVKPFHANYSPYLIIGLRADYMLSYKDVLVKEQDSGLKFGVYESILKEFNKFNVGGLIGLGVDIKQLCYFEFEFNPNLTKNFNDEGLSIRDICWGAKFGLNINRLVK